MDLNPRVPDRKTRLGEAEAVLGEMAAGLVRQGNEVLARACLRACA